MTRCNRNLSGLKGDILRSALTGLLLTALFVSPAAAMDEPDSVSLSSIEMFQDLLVTDDFLAFVPYAIPFTTQPDDNIDDTFIFRLMSTDGLTELAATVATPSYDGGYGNGAVSFYVESGMTWESAYIFRVQENPVFYPSPQYWDFVVDASNYSSDSDQESALKAKIETSAAFLGPEFGVELLTTTEAGATVLSTYGELYYLQAVPGLQSMCPSLFSVQLESPDYTKRTWSYTVADALQTKYSGTFIDDFMTGYAGLFSMQTSSAMNFLSIVLFVMLILVSTWKFKATMLAGFVDGYALLLLLMLNGIFSMIWAGFMAFVSIVIGGVILFLNKA